MGKKVKMEIKKLRKTVGRKLESSFANQD